jgi:glycosyltransferase involved in cell wall biosynthesis
LWVLGRARQPAYRWAKYAGNWRPDGAEPRTYTLQRRWLAENRHRGVVTINGRWPAPPHVHSFHNPCLTEAETAEGRVAAAAKRLDLPVELLFVGALTDGKGAGRALRVAEALGARGVPYRLQLLGDGPDRPRYEAWARERGVRAHFLGWVPRSSITAYYAKAHFILLPSRSEGWPKVLSEAMAFGVVPVAAAVSGIPQLLAETGAGVALPVEDTAGMAGAVAGYVADPDAWATAGRAGVAAAEQFTYRAYQAAVAALFDRAWGVRLALPATPRPVVDVIAPTFSTNGHGHH